MTNHMSYDYIQFLNDKVREYIPPTFKLVGNKYNGRCPFCGDSKKSQTKKRGWIYLDSGSSYYCFNCGTSMSGIKLLEYFSGKDYDDIKKEYVKLFIKSGLNSSLSSFVKDMSNEDEPNIFNFKSIINPDWKNTLSDKAVEYLRSRRIFDAPFLSETLFSTYSKDKKEEFILIPWKINGVDAYYQVNDFLKIHSMKYIFPKNKKKLLYGLDNIDPTYNKIFVFEGVYDSLFVKNAIASGTKSLNEYQINIIKQRWPKHEIIVSFDNDAAGISSMMKMIEQEKDVRFFKWFNKNTKQKDINDYVIAKDNTKIFSDAKILDKLILNKLQMKMWLIQNGLWKKEIGNFSRDNVKDTIDRRQIFKI